MPVLNFAWAPSRRWNSVFLRVLRTLGSFTPRLSGTPMWIILSFSAIAPLGLREIPGTPSLLATTALVLLALTFLRTRTVFLCLPAIATLWQIHDAVSDRLDPIFIGEQISLLGTIENLPSRQFQTTVFLFRPSSEAPPGIPRRLRIRWFNAPNDLRAGQVWRLNVKLSPPRGRVNFQGSDPERGYFAYGIGGLGSVKGEGNALVGRSVAPIQDRRAAVRDAIVTTLEEEPARDVILALGLADRSTMDSDRWALLSATGTGHLLAISGLHIGLAAGLGFWLGRGISCFFPFGLRQHLGLTATWAGSAFFALVYGALAGFGVSTVRALIMLCVVLFARASYRRISPWNLWSAACAMVLMINPLSALLPGFWLSFLAVAILIHVWAPRPGRRSWAARLLISQIALSLAMAPLTLFLFQQATGLGLLANLLAIPVVSSAVVPLVLIGVFSELLGFSTASSLALLPAAWIADGLLSVLNVLTQAAGGFIWTPKQPGTGVFVLALLGMALLFLPRQLRLFPAGCALVSCLMVDSIKTRPPRVPQLTLLDVGQGLSAILATPDHMVVYDTGPGIEGEWDLVDAVLLPAIRATGHTQPTHVYISHGDMDHAGGLKSLLHRFPNAEYHVNARKGGTVRSRCTTLDRLSAPGLRISVLHPSPWLPYLGNQSSCVLSLELPGHSVLLTGDIDVAVERRLVDAGVERHDLVLAPHHGSKSSSSELLIRTLTPRWVLIPAGTDNRFGFPSAEVTARYAQYASRTFTVSECGAIRVVFYPSRKPGISSARRNKRAIWRWPAAPQCP